MAEVVAFEDVQVNRSGTEWPGGHRRWLTHFFVPNTPDDPQAFLTESTPGRLLRTHFHAVDQFQIIVKGGGMLGKHPVTPCIVHFSRAYTPYGPIVNGENGIGFITLRGHGDRGAQFLPENRQDLDKIRDRKPWQVKEVPDFKFLEPGDKGVAMKLMDKIKDNRGLAVYSVVMKPGVKAFAPDPYRSDGQFIVVIKGGLTHRDQDHRGLTIIHVSPKESAFELVAGCEGLEGLVLNFPRPAVVGHIKSAVAANTRDFKTWHCVLCAFVYDEAEGMPDEGIPPGTRWADVPETFLCPDCSSTKADFEMIEI